MNELTGGGHSALLTDWWLPQLNSVSFWIYDPSKLSVFGVVDLVENVAAFLFEHSHQAMQVFHTVVHHELGLAWSEVVTFIGADRPDC
jgi:hypothetical protein